ncbi:hypothetical protein ACJDU8_09755 [Clostridium sp. WILCCON 0269]|uniref:RND efflux pump membrane fusion protein barrel-sandwich domain-containing protein n=1 Tax=Candidatus Clostridium eludens TaxID=3381663 RepID=A0ABW8SII7_9CLOT
MIIKLDTTDLQGQVDQGEAAIITAPISGIVNARNVIVKVILIDKAPNLRPGMFAEIGITN